MSDTEIPPAAIIESVCARFGLRLVDLSDPAEAAKWPNDPLVDHSTVCGKEVTLGLYDDPWNRLASFFHEVGHVLQDPVLPFRSLLCEMDAWVIGIKLGSREYGINWPCNVYFYVMECLKTYERFECREGGHEHG